MLTEKNRAYLNEKGNNYWLFQQRLCLPLHLTPVLTFLFIAHFLYFFVIFLANSRRGRTTCSWVTHHHKHDWLKDITWEEMRKHRRRIHILLSRLQLLIRSVTKWWIIVHYGNLGIIDRTEGEIIIQIQLSYNWQCSMGLCNAFNIVKGSIFTYLPK